MNTTPPRESETPLIPGFVMKRLERAIEDAINPKGMSTHSGKAVVQASDLRLLINKLSAANARIAELKKQLGEASEELSAFKYQRDSTERW